jgi:hypothetical protein
VVAQNVYQVNISTMNAQKCNDFGHLSNYYPSIPCEWCNLYPSKFKCISLDIHVLRRRLEREDKNYQNDDNSDITKGYTTTTTDEVDEHNHDKAKECEPTTTRQVNPKLLKNKTIQMITMNKII